MYHCYDTSHNTTHEINSVRRAWLLGVFLVLLSLTKFYLLESERPPNLRLYSKGLHRGLAGRVGAGGVPGVVTPRQQVVVISEGSMDGFASTVTKYSFES